ncbi:MAG TPA: MFS transporter [Candidatus Krumholzibacteria bacterium]|nr:MFS transporter [Candidatus Krumholzibacteria bacterium]
MTERPQPLREIVQPFVDLVRAPRALWGVNLNYLVEGFVYFGMVIYLAMYFNEYVGLDDQRAGWMVGALTSGITISMFFFGGRADRWGVRRALIVSLLLMLAGRIVLAAAPSSGLRGGAILSPLNGLSLVAILLVVLGYGIYQPAAYAAARQFTTPATANMAYAMLYAVMNLGGWLPTFMSAIRERSGIQGAYWFYTASTGLGLVLLLLVLTRNAVARGVADASAVTATPEGPVTANPSRPAATASTPASAPTPAGAGWSRPTAAARAWLWLRQHPLADAKFSFFIFCLIPVQTLFAHNWLTLPQYVSRAYAGSWVGEKFETATNLNSLLIFVLCPLVAAMTRQTKVYPMMIVGTAIMAVPTFFLALGPTVWALFAYIVVMTIGEAIWQPRFLQYAAEIAPPGRTGAYMGVAQFPWFLTKMLVPFYSGWFLQRYCPDPATGLPQNTRTLWLIYGCIAISSTLFLVLARNWVGKDFKSKA